MVAGGLGCGSCWAAAADSALLHSLTPTAAALSSPPPPQSEYGDVYRVTLDWEGETVKGALWAGVPALLARLVA